MSMYPNQTGTSMVFEYNTEKVTNYLQSAINNVSTLKGIHAHVASWDLASTKFVPFMVILSGPVFQGDKKDQVVAQSGMSDVEMFKKLYPDEDDQSVGAERIQLVDDLFKLIYRYGFNNNIAIDRDRNSYIDLINNQAFINKLGIKKDAAYKLARVFRGPREIKADNGRAAMIFFNPVYVLRDMARDDMGISEKEMDAYTVALVDMKKNSNYRYSYLLSVEQGTLFYDQKIERGTNEFDRATSLFMGQKF